MIFEKVTLENFGVYRGRHTVAFGPLRPKTPIIHFKGADGHGKITLVAALLLGLHGRFACCSKRSGLPYHQYLARVMFCGSRLQEWAGLVLVFSSKFKGGMHCFQVQRRWFHSGEGVREEVVVSLDGSVDQGLSREWDRYGREIVRPELLDLFLWDGERLEEIAGDVTQFLKAAVWGAMGIAVVDRLRENLCALAKVSQLELSSPGRPSHAIGPSAGDAEGVAGFVGGGQKSRKGARVAGGKGKQALPERTLKKMVEGKFRAEELGRVLKGAKHIAGLMDVLRQRMVENYIQRLMVFVHTSFQAIVGKRGLINKLSIDPRSLELSLFDGDGCAVAREDLSEAEWKVLAAAIGWGVAGISEHRLPWIIDLPLERLGPFGEGLFSEQHSPFANHQTILFSTDRDTDLVFHDGIQSRVGCTYNLGQDALGLASVIRAVVE